MDRDQLVRDRLSDLIRSRPPGMTPSAAVRDFVLDQVEQIRNIPRNQWRGEIGYIAAISPSVHRFVLEMGERHATAISEAIAETTEIAPEIAKLQGIALANVLQIIIGEAGSRTRKRQNQSKIADELYPIIESMLDELDRWFNSSETASWSMTESRRKRR
jgi:hypothetical protein